MRRNARRPAGGGPGRNVEVLARRAAGGDLEAARRLVRSLEDASGVTAHQRLDAALEEARNALAASEIMDVVVSYVPIAEIAKRAPADDGAILRGYREDVRGLAAEFAERIRGGDLSREGFYDALWEEVDGHSRVIWTQNAKEAVLVSGNGGAAVEEGLVGPESFRNGIPWSQLAFEAFRMDVLEELGRMGINVNSDDSFGGGDDDDEDEEEEDADDEDDDADD